MIALDLHDRPDRTRLFESDGLDPADEFLLADGSGGLESRTVFQPADQLAVLRDLTITDRDGLDEAWPLPRQSYADCTGVDRDSLVVFRADDLHGWIGRRADDELQRAGQVRGGRDGLSAPHDRSIWPKGHRPGLDRDGLAVGGFEHKRITFLHLALGPGHTPTHALRGRGWLAVEPIELDRRNRLRDGRPGENRCRYQGAAHGESSGGGKGVRGNEMGVHDFSGERGQPGRGGDYDWPLGPNQGRRKVAVLGPGVFFSRSKRHARRNRRGDQGPSGND